MTKKIKIMALYQVDKSFTSLVISIQYTSVTDGRTRDDG